MDADLGHLVLDLVHHLAETLELDLAGLAVDLGANIVLVPIFRPSGLGDRLLHRLEHLIALDRLLARDGIRHLQKFRP